MLKSRRNPFGVTRHGVPLSDVVIRKKLDVGIQLISEYGAVPELEEREAAVYCLIPWKEWKDLPWQERSSSVAQYRLHLMIEAHINDAQNEESERQFRQAQLKRNR